MEINNLTKISKEITELLLNSLQIADMVSTDFEVQEDDDNSYSINISFTGDSVGLLIGPHGKFIQSLEQIISLMLLRKLNDTEKRIYVNLDINGYRKEKEEKIVQMALQKADDARILGEAIDLPPMPAKTRRIIHMTLKKFDDITTESFGEGRDRFIRISPKDDN